MSIKICSNGKYRDTETNKFVQGLVVIEKDGKGFKAKGSNNRQFGVQPYYRTFWHRLFNSPSGYFVEFADRVTKKVHPVYADDKSLHGFAVI